MTTDILQPGEYGAYYTHYIDLAKGLALIDGLKKSQEALVSFLERIPEEKQVFSYAPGKWTVKELLQHIIDAERVFAYRAMRFARHDSTDLPGFDHDAYVQPSRANRRSLNDLLEEYELQRASTIALYKSFTDEMLVQIGRANGMPMSVRALGFVLIGHETHHCNIIKERYL